MKEKTSRRKPHIIAFLLSVLLLCVCFVCLFPVITGTPLNVWIMQKRLAHSGYIIHAGGKLKGGDGKNYKHANSIDGMQFMYDKGNRIVEMDFAFTTDGECVCLHTWEETCYTNDNDQKDKDKEGIPLSYDDFKSVKIYGYFTPTALSDVLGFLETHKDVVLVTDIKETFQPIAGTDEKEDVFALCRRIDEMAPHLKDRCIIQIYDEAEYDGVKDLGFSNIIYTLYQLPEEKQLDTAAHQLFSEEHPLVAVTFPKALLKNENFMEGMHHLKVPVFVHTIDNAKKRKKLMTEKTVTGIYTNNTTHPEI